MRRALGTLEPVIYFRNCTDPAHPRGYLLIAPYTECPTPKGYEREAADTLPDVRRLQERLVSQEKEQMEQELLRESSALAPKRKEIYDRLRQRMISSATSPYEREFIELYLRLSDEKAKKYEQRFMERTMYLHALENDTPRNRGVDEEKVSLDRLEIRS